MEIIKTTDGDTVTLALKGWLDTKTSPELAAALDGLGEDVGALELDLAGLEYISSAGVRQMVAAHKRMDGRLVLRSVSPEIREVLRLTGIDKRLHIAG